MQLTKFATLIATLQAQQPNPDGLLTVTPAVAVAAAEEFKDFVASQAVVHTPPALPIWTTVQVTSGDHEGKVGTVCGGSDSTLIVDPGTGFEQFEVDVSLVKKLA